MRVQRYNHVHFVGIGGYGMSAIARVLLDLGYTVSGSDVSQQELTEKLATRGANVFLGHVRNQVEGADAVVYNTMIAQDNVELVEARARGIPVLHRSEMLAQLMDNRQGVAITGAHGKTTTSSMIAYVMERSGLDPTFVIGGVVSNLGDNAKAGNGQYVVAEADESDASFLHYRPKIAVVTNVEADHLEHYDGKFSNLLTAYRTFIKQIPSDGLLVTSAEDGNVGSLLEEAQCPVVTFATVPGVSADYTATGIQLVDRGSICDVYEHGVRLGSLQLSLPGVHNIMNALAAIAVARHAGVDFDSIALALSEFHGAKRRFQVIADAAGVLVIDDYAHHPTEIRATIAAARAAERRIVAVFQPQRYTRTYFLFDAFAKAFHGADEVIIVDIFSPAGEKQIEGVSAERLVERIREDSNPRTQFIRTKEEVLEYLLETVHEGDLVLTMGAGDIWKVAYRLGDALRGEPMRALV